MSSSFAGSITSSIALATGELAMSSPRPNPSSKVDGIREYWARTQREARAQEGTDAAPQRAQVESEKVRENRLRRAAGRQGLRLIKSRRRDPRAVDYGRYWITGEHRMLLTSEYGVTLDEVEEYLSGEW